MTFKVRDMFSTFKCSNSSPMPITIDFTAAKQRSFFFPLIVFLISLFCFAHNAKSQINLVKDIGLGTLPSNPVGFTTINAGGTIYFIATDGTHGKELWKTDGTEGGTEMVKDINPGTADAGIYALGAFNGALYFFANDGVNGPQLWKSDGTEAGTVLFKNVIPGSFNTFIVFNGAVYFNAHDGANGVKLWKSDGTAAGTVIVKDIYTGDMWSGANGACVFNGALYFAAADNSNGVELWKTDGTVAGTTMVKDINPASASSKPQRLTVFNSELYFFTNFSNYDFDLWKTDGTAGGTVFVKGIQGSYSPPPGIPVIFNGALYFSAADYINGMELWRSDGTTAGTVMLKDINTAAANPWGEFSDGGSHPDNFIERNGILYFSATDTTYGRELWRTDGTAAGTMIIKDVYPGQHFDAVNIFYLVGNDAAPYGLVNYNGLIYFNATNGINGAELWQTDGTSAGTLLVKDMFPGFNSGITYPPVQLHLINGSLYFQASNGTHGFEPWKSDGTAAGTGMIRDINLYTGGSGLTTLTALNDKVYFAANGGVEGAELWESDGTTAGTHLIKDIYPGSNSSIPRNFTWFNNKLFFTASDGVHGTEIWMSDGTPAGTTMLKDIGPAGEFPFYLSPIGNTLYFGASDGSANNGYELWKTDGTETGTVMVKDMNSGPPPSGPGSYVVNIGGINYFSTFENTNGTELWKTDGTETGTVLIKDIRPGTDGSSPKLLTDFNDSPFFAANIGGVGGWGLWKSDGTTVGTVMVKGGFSGIFAITKVNGTLFFAANDPVNGNRLWKTDGTTAGTVIQTSNGNPVQVPNNVELCHLNGVLLFDGTDAINGTEIWKSDGTDAGTIMLKDISGGNSSSDPRYLTTANGLLFFEATDNAHGLELWRSDGTAAGTYIVQDKNPGPSNFFSGIERLAATSSKLFMTGNHFTIGAELFAMCLGGVNPCLANTSSTQFIELDNDFVNNACEVIARVDPSGTNPVSGMVTASVWKEPAVPVYLSNHYVARHFEITPAHNPAGSTGRVTLFFTQSEFDDYNNYLPGTLHLPENPADAIGKANVRIIKFPGESSDGSGLPGSYSGTPVLINPDDNDIVWNTIDARWELSINVIGFSGFIVQTSVLVLPVKLVSFKGKLNNDKTVTLQWKVEEQQGISGYTIERSVDGINFSAIGSVTANQFSSYTYQFTDMQVLKGMAFYRLRIKEMTGNTMYSDIILFSANDISVLTVFPNPAKDVISVQLKSDQLNASVKIFDEQGRLILSQTITSNVINRIDISHLAKGYYILQAINEDKVTRSAFFKK